MAEISQSMQNEEWMQFLLRDFETADQLYDAVFRAAMLISRLPFAYVSRLRHGTHLRIEAMVDMLGVGVQPGEDIPLGDLLAGEVLRKEDTLVIPDVASTPLARHSATHRFGVRCFLGTPLRLGNDQIYGVLGLMDRQPHDHLGRPELLRIGMLGRWLSRELQIRRLSRENEARAQRLSTLSLENQNLRTQLEQSSFRDPLTELLNSRYFNQLLQTETARARRHEYQISLLWLALDDFQSISRGQPLSVTHNILRSLASLLRRHLRNVDHACRYGEEVFAILLPQTDLNGASVVAERIRNTVAEHRFSLGQNTDDLQMSLSIGVAGMAPQEEEPARGMLLRARRAWEQSVNTGGNCIHYIR